MLMTIDTQDIYKTLITGGFTEEQAETVVSAMRKIDLSHLTTKQDLETAIAPMKADLMLLKWMMAFILAGIGSLIANTFFG